MLEFYEEAFVINSKDHSVCYAGGDTWDLSNGIVFRSYKYPDLTLPLPEYIPAFRHAFIEKNFEIYYSKESLLSAKKSIQYKVISNAR